MKIDNEIANLINTAYQKAREILDENMDLLHRLADLLLEKETVLGNELDELILEKRPEFDFPSKLDDDLVPKKETDTAEPDEQASEASPADQDADDETAADTPEADDTPENEPEK